MTVLLRSACLLIALVTCFPSAANSQNALAGNSMAATGSQIHDSLLTGHGAKQQSLYSQPQMPQARYALEAPRSLDQSPFPSAKFDLGFRGGGASGNGHFSGLMPVSTASVDLSIVDGGGWPLASSGSSGRTNSDSSTASGGKEQGGSGQPESANPFDLSGIFPGGMGKINGIAGPVQSSAGILNGSSNPLGNLGGLNGGNSNPFGNSSSPASGGGKAFLGSSGF